MRLEVRTISDGTDLKRLGRFLLGQALWYPAYERWVRAVCVPEIDRSWKHALVAYEGGRVVGDAVWQPHKELPKTRELKNLRVDPSFRRRALAHFLLRQVEHEGEGFDRIMCDADRRMAGAAALLRRAGYKPIAETPLYSSENVDIIFVKELAPVV
jgi:ribosomal protein S18 acetylase RimI-like enzyme